MFLSDSEIKELIETCGMIKGYKDLTIQLQPNGFDLTIRNIYELIDRGEIDFSNKNRKIPRRRELLPEKNIWNLYPRTYQFQINETIKLPSNIGAVTTQRSSLMRCGCITNVGFWDAGYNGKGISLLHIRNPKGLKLHRNARIIQMYFFEVGEDIEKLYNGMFQHEGIE